MSRTISILAVLLACAVGCAPSAREDWVEVQNLGEVALFLDMASIQRTGSKATFWTKLDSSNWLKRQFKTSENRLKRQIDCQQKTWRNLEGGLYEDGRLRYPVEDLRSGKIPPKGYIRLLHDRVCR